MSGNNGRAGRPYRRLCAQVYREETECWLCGDPVDPDLRWPHPRSRSLDHIVPISLGGSRLDRSNARLAHLDCNTIRGNRPPAATPDRTSRQW